VSEQRLHVYLDGRLVGVLSQSGSGDLRFTYDDEYRRPQATPLSLSMPLSARQHRKRTVLPFFQGLLPDSEEALRSIARRFEVSERNPFALLAHVGADVAGALQVLPVGMDPVDGIRDALRAPAALSTGEVEEMLSHAVTEYADGTPVDQRAGRFSVAGAQPKIALHRREDGQWAVAGGAHPTTHILKPVTGSMRRIDVVEWMTMQAARELGLNVAEAGIERIGRWQVLVSTRYDRLRDGEVWRRIHQEDLCQSLGVSPAKKYQRRDGGPGTAAIAALLGALPLADDRRAVGEAFYRGLVFNTLAACTDAHAKNYSLILDGERVRLAPLYDLASFAAYWDLESPIDLAMSIGGEYRVQQLTGAAIAAEARRFGLSEAQGAEIVADMRARLADAFEAAGALVAQADPSTQAVAEDLVRGIRYLPLTD
jgi:serine/threonine-protein kinase HipA